METVNEIKTLIEATDRLSEAFSGLARKLNQERAKVRRNGVYPKEELSVLHAKLWNLRSAVDQLRAEVLLAKAPGVSGMVEEQKEKRVQEWRRGEQMRKQWQQPNGSVPGKTDSFGPSIER
jgi:hypothetical protein